MKKIYHISLIYVQLNRHYLARSGQSYLNHLNLFDSIWLIYIFCQAFFALSVAWHESTTCAAGTEVGLVSRKGSLRALVSISQKDLPKSSWDLEESVSWCHWISHNSCHFNQFNQLHIIYHVFIKVVRLVECNSPLGSWRVPDLWTQDDKYNVKCNFPDFPHPRSDCTDKVYGLNYPWH